MPLSSTPRSLARTAGPDAPRLLDGCCSRPSAHAFDFRHASEERAEWASLALLRPVPESCPYASATRKPPTFSTRQTAPSAGDSQPRTRLASPALEPRIQIGRSCPCLSHPPSHKQHRSRHPCIDHCCAAYGCCCQSTRHSLPSPPPHHSEAPSRHHGAPGERRAVVLGFHPR